MKNCINCGGSDFKSLYKNTLIECKNCSLITANIEIDKETLLNIYNDNYFSGKEYDNYVEDKAGIQDNFYQRLIYILKYKNHLPINSILEIGCAYGFFADLLTQKIVNPFSYQGFDASEEAINYAKKQNIDLHFSHEDYLKAPAIKQYSDVFMWDVIEHLSEPDKFIEKISNETADDGFIYITTGNIKSLNARIRGRKWRLIHPPSHLYYFSEKSMCSFLKKYNFNVRKIKYFPVKRSVKQIFYSLFILKKGGNAISRYIYKLIPKKLSFSINTYDIMFVIAQKSK
jgi:2-polyprenyl-3-methyl-5-hydroxy-6-metoxy-1,4-benzoquinol methylase